MMNSIKRKELYQERKEQGLCPRCGKKNKKSQFVNCADCRAYYRGHSTSSSEQKARYQARLKNNLCPRCGRKHGKNYKNKLCQLCIRNLLNKREA